MLYSGPKAKFLSIFLLRFTKLFIGDLYNNGKENVVFVIMDEQVLKTVLIIHSQNVYPLISSLLSGWSDARFLKETDLIKWKQLLIVGCVYVFNNVIIDDGPRKFKLVPSKSKMIIRVTSCIEETHDDGVILMIKRYIMKS